MCWFEEGIEGKPVPKLNSSILWLFSPCVFLKKNIYIYICVHVPVKLHISISGITLLSLHPSFAIKLWSLDMTFGVISISFLFFL